MKRLIYSLLLAATLGSCTLETSNNGHLDGFWQLYSLDSLSSGTSVDMRGSHVFWSIQVRLLEARNSDGRILLRFNYTGDSLFLSNPYANARDSSDIKITDVAKLAPLGINKLEEHFAVKTLNSDNMTLESPTLRLYFRKY